MADIKLDCKETALYEEVGSRGDAFRAATRDRAAEEARVGSRESEIVNRRDEIVDAIRPGDPDPATPPAPRPPAAGVASAPPAPPAPTAPVVTDEERRNGPQALLAPNGDVEGTADDDDAPPPDPFTPPA